MDWFKNIPEDTDEEFEFSKWDEELVLIRFPAPDWGCEVDLDELDQAVLDKLHLKMEWIEDMPCNGWTNETPNN